MSSWRETLGAAALCLIAGHAAAQAKAPADYVGIGRAATAAELKAWDIDVRPDFKGLPAGSGTVAQGMDIWEAKCAACHGVFGESNQTFSPLVGGTTARDIETGLVARLDDPSFPGRTTLMKVSTVSTLWDYINRAMPWNAPKSLQTDEVYAVTAYLLNLGGIVPDDYTLSDRTMAQVQQRLPNRHGMTTDHTLWPGKPMGRARQPDVQALACMKDCGPEPSVASALPAFARNAHGNLAQQNRGVGAQRGADTTQPAPTTAQAARVAVQTAATATATATAPARPAAAGPRAPTALLAQNACTACHSVDNALVGPAFKAVARKYADRNDTVSYLAGKIRAGGAGVWGAIPMPPQGLNDNDARTIAQWLATGAAP